MTAEANKPPRLSGAARRARSFTTAISVSIVAGLIIGAVWGITHDQREAGASSGLLWAIASLSAIGIALVGWVSVRWWRDIDELARQAHYSAWLWGGSFGLFAGWVLLGLLPVASAPLAAFLQGTDPAFFTLRGGTVVAAAALIGYGLAWIIFWLQRR
jgi:hypothetical protein